MLVSKIEKGCSTSACAAVCDVCGEELEFYGVWMGCRVLNISELQLPADLNSDSESVFCNCKRPVLLSKVEKVVVTIAVTFVVETLLEVDVGPQHCAAAPSADSRTADRSHGQSTAGASSSCTLLYSRLARS